MGKTFKSGKGYGRKDWDAVSDNPKLTDEQISKAKPFAEALPELAASIRRGRGPNKAPTKKLVSLVRPSDREVQGRRPRLAIADRSVFATDQQDQVSRGIIRQARVPVPKPAI
jgi:hypothetical protein